MGCACGRPLKVVGLNPEGTEACKFYLFHISTKCRRLDMTVAQEKMEHKKYGMVDQG